MWGWLKTFQQVIDLVAYVKAQWSQWTLNAKARKDYSEQVRREEEQIHNEVKDILDHDLSDDDLLKRLQNGKF